MWPLNAVAPAGGVELNSSTTDAAGAIPSVYKKSGDDSDHIDTGFSFWDRRHSSVSYAVLLAQQETSALKTALETSHYAGINILAELKAIWFLAYPMIITYILELGPGLVSIALVGHLGTKEAIDAATFGTMFVNMTSISVCFGLISALDTLCSQAHGAKQKQKIGTYMQTAIGLVSLLLVPISVLNWSSEKCFLAAGQDPTISKLSAQFVQYLTFGIPPLIIYEIVKKSLQAQNIVSPSLVVAMLANLLNGALGYYLIFYTDLGFVGAAIARSASNYFMLGAILVYLMASKVYQEFWCGWRPRKAMRNVKIFLQLGLPGMMMMCFEWWAYEILAAMAGLLPNPLLSIGVHSVLTGVACITFMQWLGVSVAASVRVGNHLGAGRPEHAKLAALICVGLGVACALASSLFLLSMRSYLPLIYSTDPDIVLVSAQAMIILMSYQIPDAINCVNQGVMRGCGRQRTGVWINLSAYYAVGLPCSVLFGFCMKWDIQGLWWGLVMGLFFAGVLGLFVTCRIDWTDAAIKAQEQLSAHIDDTPGANSNGHGYGSISPIPGVLPRRKTLGHEMTPDGHRQGPAI